MNNSPKSKAQRKSEAEERQKIYSSLSTEQKINLANSRRGNSAKELKKLGA